MPSDVTTTNVLLAIMAAVSLLEALVVIGLLVGGFVMYRRIVRTIERIEERHVSPLATRIDAILDDVKHVSTVVGQAAGAADVAARRSTARLRALVRRRGA